MSETNRIEYKAQLTKDLDFEVTTQVTTHVTTQVRNLISVFNGTHYRQELQKKLGLANREHFRKTYLQPAIDDEYVALTIPDKPQSSKQQYRLTQKGINLLRLSKNDKIQPRL
jgi:ATP-dependent DNA helicase RecG